MRVLVVGGAGYYGRRVLAALAQVPGVEAHAAGRRGPVVVDLADSTTFSAFSGFDVVVGCHDSVGVASDAAAAWCVAEGLVWLLRMMFNLVGNWGFAIILLTFMVKLVLYPLTAASFKNMAKMSSMAAL